MPHSHAHAFRFLNAERRDGLRSRAANLLKVGLAGFGGPHPAEVAARAGA